ncbi:MAG: IS110 family transposase [Actinobacteria bacterium]|nr:IS110 family transposase [Actinomycetota bacterium]
MTRRCFGLDVHREFAQVAIWQDGVVRQAGQIDATPEGLRVFADSLAPTDEVAIEATCNTHAIAKLLEGRVARVVISNPQKTRAIAEAKVKTDKVDAAVLAQLLAADYLPGVWLADETTHALRRQVARRAHIVRQRTRLKNQVQAILHRNLIPRCPAADLFGHKGRRWLAEQQLPGDERQAVAALLRQLDFHGQELRIIDADLSRVALANADVKRLMTIPGVDATVALSIVAAVGDFGRFRTPEQLVSYLGLNPRVRQSGGQPASHGRITKQGRAHARGMLVEAAWAASKTPGPLRAFYQRIRGRRGMQIAVVATARKLAVLCWHLIAKGEDYAFARPSLTAQKMRRLELRAGLPAKRGRKGKAAGYSLKEVRARERALNEQAEQAYRQVVADWQAKRPTRKEGVAAANGARLSRPERAAARQDSAPDPALRSGVDHAHSAA